MDNGPRHPYRQRDGLRGSEDGRQTQQTLLTKGLPQTETFYFFEMESFIFLWPDGRLYPVRSFLNKKKRRKT